MITPTPPYQYSNEDAARLNDLSYREIDAHWFEHESHQLAIAMPNSPYHEGDTYDSWGLYVLLGDDRVVCIRECKTLDEIIMHSRALFVVNGEAPIFLPEFIAANTAKDVWPLSDEEWQMIGLLDATGDEDSMLRMGAGGDIKRIG